MKGLLQQGILAKAAPSQGGCLLRWGTTDEVHLPQTLVCEPSVRQGQGKLWLWSEGAWIEQSFERHDQEVIWQAPDDLCVHFSWQLFGDEEPIFLRESKGKHLWIPLQGWFDEQWYDGSVAALSDGALRAWVGPGCEGWLSVDLEEQIKDDQVLPLEAFPWPWAEATKCSLRLALQKRLDPAGRTLHYRFCGDLAIDLALLLGLRIAFPETRIVADPTVFAEVAPWKRVLQNLNVVMREPKHAELLLLEARYLWPMSSRVPFISMLKQLQARAPFIPIGLSKGFS